MIGFHVLRDIGSTSEPAGIRELDSDRRVVHIISGNLDSDPEESAVVREHPEGARRGCEHWIAPALQSPALVNFASAERVRKLDHSNVEGIAIEGDFDWYALGAEDIVLLYSGAR